MKSNKYIWLTGHKHLVICTIKGYLKLKFNLVIVSGTLIIIGYGMRMVSIHAASRKKSDMVIKMFHFNIQLDINLDIRTISTFISFKVSEQ